MFYNFESKTWLITGSGSSINLVPNKSHFNGRQDAFFIDEKTETSKVFTKKL